MSDWPIGGLSAAVCQRERDGSVDEVGSENNMSCHMGMTRREVLVQLDDDLVEQLDRLASVLFVSRSELIRRGARSLLDAESNREADVELAAAYRRNPPDPGLLKSARTLAAKTAGSW